MRRTFSRIHIQGSICVACCFDLVYKGLHCLGISKPLQAERYCPAPPHLRGEHVRNLAASKAEHFSLTWKASSSPTCTCTGIFIFPGCTSKTSCQALAYHILSCKPYELSSVLHGQVSSKERRGCKGRRVQLGGNCAYMAELCRRCAIKGRCRVKAGILCTQKAQSPSHAESCHANLRDCTYASDRTQNMVQNRSAFCFRSKQDCKWDLQLSMGRQKRTLGAPFSRSHFAAVVISSTACLKSRFSISCTSMLSSSLPCLLQTSSSLPGWWCLKVPY